MDDNDYMIAAKKGKFIAPGFRHCDLVPYLNNYPIDSFFRSFTYLPEEIAKRLLLLMNDAPDATDEYVSEIQRLEEWALENWGYMYINRTRGFSWDDAARPMKLES